MSIQLPGIGEQNMPQIVKGDVLDQFPFVYRGLFFQFSPPVMNPRLGQPIRPL